MKIFCFRHKETSTPKKILFLEIFEMGSVILSYPAIKKAKELYPDARLYFWTSKNNSKVSEILGIIPYANIIAMSDDSIINLAIDIARFILQIRKERIDTIIDLELFSRFSAILSYLSGAKIRAGFNSLSQKRIYRGNFQTHSALYDPNKHISSNFISLVESLGYKSEKNEPTLPKIESEQKLKIRIWNELVGMQKDINEGAKLVIFNMDLSKALPLRRWPIENYIGLARRFLEDKNVFIIMIGKESNAQEIKKLVQLCGEERIIDLIGKTELEELLALFNISRLFISHDSGPVHVAALTRINIIALFGPETPVCYSPISSNAVILYSGLACSPCLSAYNFRHSTCEDNKCLKAISIEEVYENSRRYL